MQKKSVLLADDDIDDREMFEEILADNHQVELVGSVENGQELLSFLTENGSTQLPDLIVLDHNMPKMNGIQTLEALKKNESYQHIPVVIFSTYCDNKLLSECTNLGAAMVFTKPSSFDEYEQMITAFLDVIPAS
ncbi:MAG: response regulator [Chitinophagaceae bacterium]|nr:MAG: response regulator [Chitinophagaceae bacterium]